MTHLGGGVLLAVWEPGPGGGDTPPGFVLATLDQRVKATAMSRLRVECATADGAAGSRCLLLVHFPADVLARASCLELRGDDGPADVALESVPDADATACAGTLLHGLDAPARMRLVRWLLRFCGGLPELVSTAGAVPIVQALLAACAADRADLELTLSLPGRHLLLAAAVPRPLGNVQFVAMLSPGGIALSRVAAARHASPLVAVEARLLRGAQWCVIACRDGVAVRRLTPAGLRHADLVRWMRAHADDQGHELAAVLAAIEPLAARHGAVRALGLELQLRFPQRRQASVQPAAPVAAELRIAPMDRDGGVFLSGWVHDPNALLASARMDALPETSRPVDLDAGRFPSRHAAKRCEELGRSVSGGRLGFAAYVPGQSAALRCLQPRLELALHSGSRVRLVPSLQTPDPALAKAAVLSSVPAEFVSPYLLEHCIAPAVRRLHAEHLACERVEREIVFGSPPPSPAVSVVIPLYRNLDYLKTQLAAFAVDRELGACEIVLVLDSPEIADALIHLLTGLHRCYGLALRLVVMRQNFGYAAACNAGAGVARGPELLMLNSDVLPRGPGWLVPMRRALREHDGVGAVGPKLLFDDGSLQHAGLHFAQDGNGRWMNRHYFKGMPGAFPPAGIARDVPAVTGACLLVQTSAFNRVGGYCEDYVFGDYEDSDLCLRLRREGYRIRYEPAAVLHHLERKSIALHREYMQSAAWLYNCAHHQALWADEMAELTQRFDAPADTSPARRPGGRTPKKKRKSRAASRPARGNRVA